MFHSKKKKTRTMFHHNLLIHAKACKETALKAALAPLKDAIHQRKPGCRRVPTVDARWSAGALQPDRSPARLSKLTAFSMSQWRRITPSRYKGARRQSKALVSTGVDSGQLLEVIKGFEPEISSRASLCAASPRPAPQPSSPLQA